MIVIAGRVRSYCWLLQLGTTISDLEKEIETYLQNHQLQTPQQIQNTINHICNLATQL